MAGDYIPMRTDLFDDDRVHVISMQLDIPVEHVIGCLFRVWSAFGKNTTNGKMSKLPREWVDRLVHVPKFGVAMEEAGWLTVNADGLEMPRFDRWLSKSAKTRLENARRARASRSRHGESATNGSTTEEERRGEKRREEELSARAPQQEYQAPPQTPTPHPFYDRNRSERAEGWSEFWDRYPKKTGKHHAEREWDRLAPGESERARIRKFVEAMMSSGRWGSPENGWQFCPRADNFLRDADWVDWSPSAAPPTDRARALVEAAQRRLKDGQVKQ